MIPSIPILFIPLLLSLSDSTEARRRHRRACPASGTRSSVLPQPTGGYNEGPGDPPEQGGNITAVPPPTSTSVHISPSESASISASGSASPISEFVPGSSISPSPSDIASVQTLPNAGLGIKSTFLVDLNNRNIDAPILTTESGINIDSSVYIVDMEGHEAADIQGYKDAGKTVICYFSAGTLEPFRNDLGGLNPECACGPGGTLTSSNECSTQDNRMDGWNEWWLNLHTEECKANVKEVMSGRIQAAKDKGCDGVDPDNVDSYINDAQQHGNTQADQADYLLWLSQTAREAGLLIDLKNVGDMLESSYGEEIIAAFDFNVIESCHVYSECDIYDPFLEAGKPQIQIEYGSKFTECPPVLKKGQNFVQYSEDSLDSGIITLNCPTA